MGPDDDRGLPGGDRLDGLAPCPRPRSEPVSRVTAEPEVLEQGATVSRCWRASRSVGCEQRRLPSGERRGRERPGRDGGLARPDVALHAAGASARAARGRPGSHRSRALVRVSRTARPACARARPRARPGSRRSIAGSTVDRRRLAAAARPAPADHAQLERQQLVEGEAAEGRVPGLEGPRVVGRLERLGDGRDLLVGRDRRRAGTRDRHAPLDRAPPASPSAGGRRSGRGSAGTRARSGPRGGAFDASARWNSGSSKTIADRGA